MKRTTISIPDKLLGKIKQKVEEEGFLSMTDYIVSLVREDTKGISLSQPFPAYQNVVPQFTNPDFTVQPIIKPIFPPPLQPPTKIQPETLEESIARIPPTPKLQPLHPKVPVRDPNAPDPYLVYGGKCQYKNINAGNVMCLYQASRKLSVAQNETGDQPTLDQYQQVYLCPDHTSEVSHRSGFFVK